MLLNKNKKFLLVGILVLFIIFNSLPILTQGQSEAQIQAQEAALRAELVKIEAEITAQQKLLSSKQKETASIQRDVDILTYKINTAQLNIKAKELEIKRLGSDITKKVETINVLDDKLGEQKKTLRELLRKTRELDDHSFLEIALGGDSLSTFFVDLGRFDFLEKSTQASLSAVRSTIGQTEGEKANLEKRRDAEFNARRVIESEKAKIESLNKEKKMYLSVSKTQESAYKMVISQKEKQRAAIRSALFNLRGAKSITFGEAYDLAKLVSAQTGVRPAFLLAIITQESNLGKNVGTCNRPGDPPEKSWREIMKPGRDYEPYIRITSALGIDPDVQPLSCPLGGGYGGAMGPAQFIPSTWETYQSRIAKATGNNPPSPWNPLDAFTASGLFLADLGANAQTYAAERKAALRYYAGENWNNPKNAFYGNQVMELVSEYESQIAILQND